MLVPDGYIYDSDGSKIQKWIEESEEDILKNIENTIDRNYVRARTDPKWKAKAIKRAYQIYLGFISEIRQAEPPDLP